MSDLRPLFDAARPDLPPTRLSIDAIAANGRRIRRRRRTATFAAVAVLAVVAGIGGVLGAAGLGGNPTPPAQRPTTSLAPARDAAPEDNAHWSANQRAAAQIAAQALAEQKIAAAKILSSESTGEDSIYVTKWTTSMKGAFTVTVNLSTNSVISIEES